MPKYFEDCDDFGCAVQGCSDGCVHKPPDCILALPASFLDADEQVFERFWSPLSRGWHSVGYVNPATQAWYGKVHRERAEDCAAYWRNEIELGILDEKIKTYIL